MTDRNESETDPTAQEEERQILLPNSVPIYLDPFFIEEFEDGIYKEYFTEGGGKWTIEHYTDKKNKKIILLFPAAYFDLSTYKITILDEDTRLVQEIVRDSKENLLKTVDTYRQMSDGIWTPIQSSDQNPNDQQL